MQNDLVLHLVTLSMYITALATPFTPSQSRLLLTLIRQKQEDQLQQIPRLLIANKKIQDTR